jgi:hypothetical protein
MWRHALHFFIHSMPWTLFSSLRSSKHLILLPDRLNYLLGYTIEIHCKILTTGIDDKGHWTWSTASIWDLNFTPLEFIFVRKNALHIFIPDRSQQNVQRIWSIPVTVIRNIECVCVCVGGELVKQNAAEISAPQFLAELLISLHT